MMFGPPQMASTVARFSSTGIGLVDYGASVDNGEGLLAGDPQPPTPIVGHYFPAPGETITRLELESSANVLEVHTPEPSLTAQTKGSSQRGSVLVIDSKTYAVVSLAPWFDGPAGDVSWQVAICQEVVR